MFQFQEQIAGSLLPDSSLSPMKAGIGLAEKFV